jgi:hypothetical protein
MKSYNLVMDIILDFFRDSGKYYVKILGQTCEEKKDARVGEKGIVSYPVVKGSKASAFNMV